MGKTFDFSGIWHSTYQYINKLEPKGNISQHDVKIYQTGRQVVLQSISNTEESYFVARLSLDDNISILTGTWEEETSPTGLYKGETYFGAGQLIIDETGDHMQGKVTMYNHEMQIICGDWNLTRTEQTPRS